MLLICRTSVKVTRQLLHYEGLQSLKRWEMFTLVRNFNRRLIATGAQQKHMRRTEYFDDPFICLLFLPSLRSLSLSFQLNFGPQHPAAHGVLRLVIVIQLDKEVSRWRMYVEMMTVTELCFSFRRWLRQSPISAILWMSGLREHDVQRTRTVLQVRALLLDEF